MRLLITGASGFIGSALLRQLDPADVESVHAVSRTNRSAHETPRELNSKLFWHSFNLLSNRRIDDLFAAINPTHVIHGAWDTTHGRFWTCESNRDWLSASLRLLDAFERHGGKRFIFLGSMAEYDWSSMPLIEQQSQDIPFTLYGEMKLAFHRILMRRAQSCSYTAANARIFNLYGPGEKTERLIPQLIGAIAQSRRIKTGSAERLRDFLHVDDVARAILALLKSDLEDAVNIADGTPTRLGDLFSLIGRLTGGAHLIGVGERADTPGEPARIYADASRIRSTGWAPKITLEQGMKELWARASLLHAA